MNNTKQTNKKNNTNTNKKNNTNNNKKTNNTYFDNDILNNNNNKKFICNKCSLEFNDDMALRNHKSYKHPVDKYEYTWREAIRNNDNMSLGYMDDPYY